MRGARTGRRIARLALPGLLCALAGCGDERAARPPVLLIGVDGLEWTLVERFAADGDLPCLAALMERGVAGRLETLTPTVSPAIWTTIATGKRPEEHGIRSFAYRDAAGLRLYTSGHRRTKALWNIASERGLEVDCIGWWCTYPAEPIRGVMVAQTGTREQTDVRWARNVWKGTVREGVPAQVFPPAREEEMLDLADDVRERLPRLERETFGAPRHPLHELTRRLRESSTWSLAADQTYLEIARRLLQDGEAPDLLMVYFGQVDVVSHRFLRYQEPALFRHPPTAAEVEDFGEMVRCAYRWVDAAVADLVALAPGAAVVVVSDHGFHPTNRDATFDPDTPPADANSGAHDDGPDGVLIAAGPGIRDAEQGPAGALERLGSVCDVAPTVLALLDVPPADDLCGDALAEVLTPQVLAGVEPGVASHDDDVWLRAQGERRRASEALEEALARSGDDAARRAEEARLEQLRALGYLRGTEDEGAPDRSR